MIVLDGRVVFLVDSCDVPRWQAALFDSVSASTEIGVFAIGPVRAARTPPIAARVYAWLDAWSSRRLGADAGAGSVHVAATWAAIEDAVDAASWIVDLTSTRRASALPTSATPILTVSGEAVDAEALMAALHAGARSVEAAVEVRSAGLSGVLEQSNVAVSRLSLQRSGARVGWRTAELVRRALARLADGKGVRSELHSRPANVRTASTFDLARLVAAGALSIGRIALTRPDWRVAWGQRDDSDPFTLPERMTTLASPPGHFFADPFVVESEGRGYVFLEDYDLALGRASIAVAELGVDAVPATILCAQHHFSYPFVFSHDGTWYMVPETAEARRITLYRCLEFPHRWEEDTVLFDGLTAYDPTILFHDDRWWLFYSTGTEHSSSDDELHVFVGSTLRGPFIAHSENPVRSDAVGARPAGRIVEVGGRLLRPGQDGSREYGGGIVVSQIVVLTAAHYEERELLRVSLPAGRSASGVHTINFSESFVVVDTKHQVLRYAPLARAPRMRARLTS